MEGFRLLPGESYNDFSDSEDSDDEDIENDYMERIGTKRKESTLLSLETDPLYKRLKHDEDDSHFVSYRTKPPSLESIAVISIATRLCSQPDLKKDFEQMSYSQETGDSENKTSYQILLKKVFKKLSELGLPKALNVKVSNVVRPILLQLLKCFRACEEDYHQIQKFLKERGSISWTMQGTIDKAASLRGLMGTTSESRRFYYMACKFCMEDCVSELWGKLSEVEKQRLYLLDHRYNFHIGFYWNAVVKNELDFFMLRIKPYDIYSIYDTHASMNQNMVSLAVHCVNPLSLRYFWQKLTQREIDSCVKRWFIACIENTSPTQLHPKSFLYQEYYERTDVMCFLLTNMSPGEQKEMFQSYSMDILKSLFCSWPFQEYFLPTIAEMLNYLDEYSYVSIMGDIYKEIEVGRSTNELFREVWILSPLRLKDKLLCQFPSSWLLHRPVWKFLSVGDVETLFILLKDTKPAVKSRVMFDIARDRKALFDILITNKLDLLEELMSKTLSALDYAIFKDRVKSNHACFLFHCLTCRGAFQTAEKLLKWVVTSPAEIKSFKKTSLNPETLYYHLAKCGDRENFDAFMHWYFESNDKIKKFKRTTIVNKMNSSYEREKLLVKFCGCGADAWDRFEKYFTWSTDNLCTQRQISNYRKLFLPGVASVVANIHNFDFASKLLEWCSDSSDEVSKFKYNLLFSDQIIDSLVREIYSKEVAWERVETLMMWFVPLTDDMVAELKSELEETEPYKKNKLRAFYRLLDRLVAEFNVPGSVTDQLSKAVGLEIWDYDFFKEEDENPKDYFSE